MEWAKVSPPGYEGNSCLERRRADSGVVEDLVRVFTPGDGDNSYMERRVDGGVDRDLARVSTPGHEGNFYLDRRRADIMETRPGFPLQGMKETLT